MFNDITLTNGKKFLLTPINSRSIEVETKDSFIQVNKAGKIIQSILLGGEKKISLGDEVSCYIVDTLSYYKISSITQITKNLFQLSCEDLTKTSLYLLPCLGGTRNIFGWSYLYNSYITDYNSDNPKLKLTYRFVGSENYNKLENFLINHKFYICTKEENKYLTSYIFSIPDEYKQDYHSFLDGKFSLLSEKLKQNILVFHGFNKRTNVYKILYKSKELKTELEKELGIELEENCELASIPDQKIEII